jgi:hypothetical protein
MFKISRHEGYWWELMIEFENFPGLKTRPFFDADRPRLKPQIRNRIQISGSETQEYPGILRVFSRIAWNKR